MILVERVKILVARKRGPRPGWKKLPIGAVRAMEHRLKSTSCVAKQRLA